MLSACCFLRLLEGCSNAAERVRENQPAVNAVVNDFADALGESLDGLELAV